MSFARISKKKEVIYITRLLSIFGVVETQQMRELFSHLPNEKYGQLLIKLKREGYLRYSSNGQYLSSAEIPMDNSRIADSVRAFWVVIHVKDKINDFCSGEDPVLLSVASTEKRGDYDLILVKKENREEIIRHAERCPCDVRRILIVSDIKETAGLTYRTENDYVAIVDHSGTVTTYGM